MLPLFKETVIKDRVHKFEKCDLFSLISCQKKSRGLLKTALQPLPAVRENLIRKQEHSLEHCMPSWR